MSFPGSIFSEVETWVRRIVKTASSQSLTSDTIRDYANRFYLYDLPGELQLFELNRRFSFDTQPNINYYTFPPRSSNNQPSTDYPIIRPPIYCDGIEIGFFPDNFSFYRAFPEQVYNNSQINGDGSAGNYTMTLTYHPIQRSHADVLRNINPALIISAQGVSGNINYLIDGGDGNLYPVDYLFNGITFDSNGVIQSPAPQGTVDYLTGNLDFTFSESIPSGTPIYVQCLPYSAARPIAIIFFDNYIKTYPVPDKVYKIDCLVQITPSEFMDSSASVPFAYMSEYIARGTARKILFDSLDEAQLAAYERPFREQEAIVLRRTSRQKQVTRTPTIFSGQSFRYNTGWPYQQY